MVDERLSAGVDRPQLTLLRDGALLDAHAALKRRLGFAFPPKTFATYEAPARISRGTWARIGERTPAVVVGFSHVEPGRGTDRLYSGRAVWNVFLVVKQPRIDNMLAGDARMPGGLLGLAQVAVAVLHSQTDREVGTWFCGAVQNYYDEGWANDDLGVIGIEVSLQVQITDPAAAAALPNFMRLGVALEWDLPPLPSIEGALPAIISNGAT